VVRPHARERGKDDGGHAGGNRHFDGQVCIDALFGHDDREKGHQHHAATYAQQPGQKPPAQAQQQQLQHQQRVEHSQERQGG